MHVVDHFRPLEFPGVAEAQPLVGIFLLPALRDDLAEQAEIVADAVADRGDRERRHAFHEAGREPPEAAIAERRVRLAFAQIGQADAEIAERGLEHLQQPHIVERVAEQAADQEFQREVIDPLGAGVVALLFGRQPAVHDAVAQRQRRCLVPVVPGRHAGILADRKPELGQDRALDLGQRQFVDGRPGAGKFAGNDGSGKSGIPATLSCQMIRASCPRSKPAGGPRLCNACMVFMQGPGRFRHAARMPASVIE